MSSPPPGRLSTHNEWYANANLDKAFNELDNIRKSWGEPSARKRVSSRLSGGILATDDESMGRRSAAPKLVTLSSNLHPAVSEAKSPVARPSRRRVQIIDVPLPAAPRAEESICAGPLPRFSSILKPQSVISVDGANVPLSDSCAETEQVTSPGRVSVVLNFTPCREDKTCGSEQNRAPTAPPSEKPQVSAPIRKSLFNVPPSSAFTNTFSSVRPGRASVKPPLLFSPPKEHTVGAAAWAIPVENHAKTGIPRQTARKTSPLGKMVLEDDRTQRTDRTSNFRSAQPAAKPQQMLSTRKSIFSAPPSSAFTRAHDSTHSAKVEPLLLSTPSTGERGAATWMIPAEPEHPKAAKRALRRGRSPQKPDETKLVEPFVDEDPHVRRVKEAFAACRTAQLAVIDIDRFLELHDQDPSGKSKLQKVQLCGELLKNSQSN